MIDYKITEEQGTPDNITFQRVRYYEGDVTTENEPDVYGGLVPVTRYRRSILLEEVEYWYE